MNINKVIQFSLGPIGVALLSLITLPMATWLFSAEDIGRLSMVQVTVSFTILLCGLGLDQAFVREFHVVNSNSRASLLKSTMVPGSFFLILLMAISFIIPQSISYLLFGVDSLFITLLLYICIVLSFFSRFQGLILRMEERSISFSLSLLLPKIIFLIILLSYYFLQVDKTFSNLIIAQTTSIFVAFTLLLYLTRKFLKMVFVSQIDLVHIKYMLRYAIPLVGGGLAFWGLTVTDKFFLRTYSSFEELGIYSVAFSFAGAGLLLKAIFSTVWAPTVYKWCSQGDNTDSIITVINSMALLTILVWSITGMFTWVLVFFLPHKYESVQTLLMVAIAYPLLYTLSEATSVGIGIKRKTLFSLMATIIALLINVCGNYLLVPALGAKGAGISSAIAFFMFFVIKTEVSIKIYLPFPRLKLYLLIFSLVLFSIVINLITVSLKVRLMFFLVVTFFALFIYSEQFLGLFALCKRLKSKPK